MNEEVVSAGLFRSGVADPEIEVLSWQSVDGKGYFAADIKLRLPDDRRAEPDLILLLDGQVWLIEVKGRHSEALSDEAKLADLLSALGDAEIARQVGLRSGTDVSGSEVVLAVAFAGDDLDESPVGEAQSEVLCGDAVLHVDWEQLELAVLQAGLSSVLRELYSAQQSRT